MTTLERIESKKNLIIKKQNLIAKKTSWIAKKQEALNNTVGENERLWLQFDINHYEEDIKYANKAIDEAEKDIIELEAKLAKEEEKASKRNVKVLLDFINNWEEEAKEYYHNLYEEYMIERKDYRNMTLEEKRNFKEKYNFIIACSDSYMNTLDKIDKEIEAEGIRKYDDIIARAGSYVGNITDAQGLHIGDNLNLNGVIIGDKGKCRVTTIYAGGYNIQRLHFRVLINRY